MVSVPRVGLLAPPFRTLLKAWPQRLLSAFAVCWPCALPLLVTNAAHASVSCPDSGLKPVSAFATRVKSPLIGSDTLIPILDCSSPLSASVDTEPAKFRVGGEAWYHR